MATDAGQPGASLAIMVCYALPRTVWHRELCLPQGATLQQAIDASGFAAAFPRVNPASSGTGVFGKLKPLDYRLHDHDRVEIYRALSFDPMDSRRRRAHHKAKKGKAIHQLEKSARNKA